jgi:hypothetical protein
MCDAGDRDRCGIAQRGASTHARGRRGFATVRSCDIENRGERTDRRTPGGERTTASTDASRDAGSRNGPARDDGNLDVARARVMLHRHRRR